MAAACPWRIVGLVTLLLGLPHGAAAETSSDDLLALIQIKASFDPTPLLVNCTFPGSDPCGGTWFGVRTCTNDPVQRVSVLQLQNANLSGTISPFVGNMTGLNGLKWS